MSRSRTELLQARRRIDVAIMREISLSYATGDHLFLEWCGVDLNTARLIHEMSTGASTRLAMNIRNGVFTVRTDNEALQGSLRIIASDTCRTQQLYDLIEVGASLSMVTELGFSVAQLEIPWKRGRPCELTERDERCVRAYWHGWRNPEKADPVDILIQTCRYTGVSAQALWSFIVEKDTDARTLSMHTPPHESPWVRTMFPNWGNRNH